MGDSHTVKGFIGSVVETTQQSRHINFSTDIKMYDNNYGGSSTSYSIPFYGHVLVPHNFSIPHMIPLDYSLNLVLMHPIMVHRHILMYLDLHVIVLPM